MENEYAKGHRRRLKEKYLSGGFSHDYELLELLLTYSVPRRDVKPAAKNLLARFGSVEGVLKAKPEELLQVDGIGESSALLIAAVNEFNNRAFKVQVGEELTSPQSIGSYCHTALEGTESGTVIMVTLNNSGRVISCNDVTADYNLYFEIGNVKPFGNILLRDSAARAVFAQKADNTLPHPSSGAISFVIKMNSFLRSIELRLDDFIIIGRGGNFYSMNASERYGKYFY